MTAEDAAAGWLARLRSGAVTAKEREAFVAWREADPAHRAAFEAVERAWSATGEAAGHEAVRAMRAAALASSSRRRKWIPMGVAAAVLVVVGIAAAWVAYRTSFMMPGSPLAQLVAGANPDRPPFFSTAVGERSTVALDDGSTIVLNTQTRVRVDYGAAERAVILLKGQALFEVAKDPQRPFVVRAGDRRIRALGTAFDVRLNEDEVRVTLLEGRVAVEEALVTRPDQPARRPPRRSELTAGQQLVATTAGADQVLAADVERVTSWREGRLIFENELLNEAVAEVNRYSDRKIMLTDPSLNDLRVSGVFRTGSPTSFVGALSDYFPIEATSSDPQGNIFLAWRENHSPAEAH